MAAAVITVAIQVSKKCRQCRTAEPANNGYVKPELKVVVGDDASGMSSFPNTPQRTWQSPDHIREPASVSRYVVSLFRIICFAFFCYIPLIYMQLHLLATKWDVIVSSL